MMRVNVNTERSLETLQGILDACCERHDQCNGCRMIKPCRALWDKVSERAYSKPFSLEHLQNYIAEFARLWQEEEISENGPTYTSLN